MVKTKIKKCVHSEKCIFVKINFSEWTQLLKKELSNLVKLNLKVLFLIHFK